MKLQIVLWTILAMSVTSLVIGCAEWLKRRGHRLVLAGIPNVALAINMLLGDSHPIWRYTCLVMRERQNSDCTCPRQVHDVVGEALHRGSPRGKSFGMPATR